MVRSENEPFRQSSYAILFVKYKWFGGRSGASSQGTRSHFVVFRDSHSPYSTERVPTKQDETIVTSIHKIDDIRKTVNQMKDVNTALETMLHTYEVTPNSDDRLSLQKKIGVIIERGNAIAASSRVDSISIVFSSSPFKPSSWTTTTVFVEVFPPASTSGISEGSEC